jgi:hypothetical protein
MEKNRFEFSHFALRSVLLSLLTIFILWGCDNRPEWQKLQDRADELDEKASILVKENSRQLSALFDNIDIILSNAHNYAHIREIDETHPLFDSVTAGYIMFRKHPDTAFYTGMTSSNTLFQRIENVDSIGNYDERELTLIRTELKSDSFLYPPADALRIEEETAKALAYKFLVVTDTWVRTVPDVSWEDKTYSESLILKKIHVYRIVDRRELGSFFLTGVSADTTYMTQSYSDLDQKAAPGAVMGMIEAQLHLKCDSLLFGIRR